MYVIMPCENFQTRPWLLVPVPCHFFFILCLRYMPFSKLPSLLSLTEMSNLQEIWERIQCRTKETGTGIEQQCTSRAILDSPCPVDSRCRKGPITGKENSDFFFLFFPNFWNYHKYIPHDYVIFIHISVVCAFITENAIWMCICFVNSTL